MTFNNYLEERDRAQTILLDSIGVQNKRGGGIIHSAGISRVGMSVTIVVSGIMPPAGIGCPAKERKECRFCGKYNHFASC